MGHKKTVDDVPVGTWGNKYDTKNPVKRYLLNRFLDSIKKSVYEVSSEVENILELGCGEGYVTNLVAEAYPDKNITGSDYASEIIEFAKKNNSRTNILYRVDDIYSIDINEKFDLVMCCEVLEHLDYPEKALESIKALNSKYVILSVPHEPWWRLLQMMAGNHITKLGNTPGHINHWSKNKFKKMISEHFDIIQDNSKLPWTLLLLKNKS